jgi:nucleoside-diphosphate-sugar epimerase
MRIVLLQDEIYLPSLAGGTKANRCLMEALAERGHECVALTRALTRSPDGPRDLPQFRQEMDRRQLQLREPEADVFCYEFRGVQVDAVNGNSTGKRSDYITRRLQALQPDRVLVADDKRRFMLPSASQAVPGRALPLLQTIIQLPFGPLSVQPGEHWTRLMREAPAIIVISEFMQTYIRQHGQMESRVLRMPVYGPGPFPDLARHDSGFVTMINPCVLKGLDIFLALARRFPDTPFAAVPTWGADDQVRRVLADLPNMRILEPSDEIDDILRQTRILLVPSLWPETFGYVVPEAMLRGIPVMASNIGGLPEAKLGVDYLMPVIPARWDGHQWLYACQDVEPWARSLGQLLDDAEVYRRCSQQSRQAASEFASQISLAGFEELLSCPGDH